MIKLIIDYAYKSYYIKVKNNIKKNTKYISKNSDVIFNSDENCKLHKQKT